MESERRTAVAMDGTVSFADDTIEELARQKLSKKPSEPVTLKELQAIRDLSLVGISSEDYSMTCTFCRLRSPGIT